MKIRYLGHSCVEIIGSHHILIDPDFTSDPEPDVEYICVTHAHMDHIGRVADLPTGIVLATAETCRAAEELGVPRARLQPVSPGDQVANIRMLPGFSRVNDPVYLFFYMLFRRRRPEPGGKPLSFWVEDEASLLHIGDAHEVDLQVRSDILCLPWRTTPFRPRRYKEMIIEMAEQLNAPYVLPIHYDMPPTDADPSELQAELSAFVLRGREWRFRNHRLISF